MASWIMIPRRLVIQEVEVTGPREGDFGHSLWHLTTVLEGGFEHRTDWGWRFLGPGDFRLSCPGARHRLRFGTGVTRCAIALLPSAWIAKPLRRRLAEGDDLFGEVGELTELARLDRISQEIRIREFIAGLAREDHPAADAEWLDKVRAWLWDNHYPVGEAARRAGVTPEHLTRMFQRRFGVTPVEYRLASRTLAALRLLRETDKPLSEITYEVGFATQSHMTHAIRRWARSTPRRIRQAARHARTSEIGFLQDATAVAG